MGYDRSTWMVCIALAGLGGLIGAGLALHGGPVALAQGSALTAGTSTSRIATLDIFSVVERAWLDAKYREPREALAQQTNTQLQAFADRLKGIEARFRELPADATEEQRRAVADEYQAVQREAQELQQRGESELEQLSVLQLGEVYRLVLDQAQKVARERGYTHVVGSRGGDVQFRSTNVNGVLQEMLARPIVVAASDDDITVQVAAAFPALPAAPAAPLAPAAAPDAVPAPPAPR